MTKLTTKEILEALNIAYMSGDNKKITELKEAYGDDENIATIIRSMVDECEPEDLTKAFPDLLEIASYDSGGEGSAEDAPEFVLKYKPTDQFIGLTGWYQSYHGTDWDEDFHEFEPTPVIVYRRK